MKVALRSFSGYKIYTGHGRCYTRTDGKVFQFLNAKCEPAFLTKRNPRQINWTVLYRRKHKKGQLEEIQKKRTQRAVKFQRAITGASLADIMAKRNQKPEVRKAQREQKRLNNPILINVYMTNFIMETLVYEENFNKIFHFHL
uniref:Large ribosomal subunit protein eL24 n=1 Tax=Urocitellus parryii TaxID=9999 RepID=A0A8D2KH93_UROPR